MVSQWVGESREDYLERSREYWKKYWARLKAGEVGNFAQWKRKNKERQVKFRQRKKEQKSKD